MVNFGVNMYQAYVYLETRILLSAVPGVFVLDSAEKGQKNILSAKAEFLEKNNNRVPVKAVSVQPAALRKVVTFVRAIGGTVLEKAKLERLTGNIQEPPDDKGFTGYSVKVGEGGSLDIMFHQKAKKIQIEEVRIEEDCGRLTRTGGKTRMDWTYAGCPSMRIRTSASFELGEEAEIFLSELYTVLAYLKLITGELGESSVRCNAYAALADYPAKPEYFVKLRNLNSFNFVRKAINGELSREEEILSTGGQIASESRLWIEEQNTTESFQSRKEDLVRFEALSPAVMVKIASSASDGAVEVELPSVRRARLRNTFGLSRLRAEFICAEKDRADYFEKAVACGADPMLSAHWMASELMRLLNRDKKSIRQTNLTAEKFAEILKMLSQGTIHSLFAKNLMQTVCSTGEDPVEIVKKTGKILISNEKDLLPFVQKALEENKESVRLLQNGDMAPLEYLTGCVMKATDGCAVPQNVKALIKKQLKISVVYVLTMGGAMTAKKVADGTVRAGDAEIIRTMLGRKEKDSPVQIIPVRTMLSEETEPADWAHLVAEIAERIESGTANGIVITHGTDTLPYTAALLFWLFGAASVPVVLTASSTLPEESEEAKQNLMLALETAREKSNGVYVVYGGRIHSPLNLKFINTTSDGFVNWNLTKKTFTTHGFLSQQFLSVSTPDCESMIELLNEAAARLLVVRLYPGQPSTQLERMLNVEVPTKTSGGAGLAAIVLELYAQGTGNMRNSDYSLKPLLQNGKKQGCKFYCTSQQECSVDFSEYSTSARVWREGAVPMGVLTTESVVALYFASYLIADSDAELNELMEGSIDVIEG